MTNLQEHNFQDFAVEGSDKEEEEEAEAEDERATGKPLGWIGGSAGLVSRRSEMLRRLVALAAIGLVLVARNSARCSPSQQQQPSEQSSLAQVINQNQSSSSWPDRPPRAAR